MVRGTADPYQQTGYRLAYELGATFERVEGAKHFVPETNHPERVAAAVNELLGLVAPGR